jgi:hypothetical protein
LFRTIDGLGVDLKLTLRFPKTGAFFDQKDLEKLRSSHFEISETGQKSEIKKLNKWDQLVPEFSKSSLVSTLLNGNFDKNRRTI